MARKIQLPALGENVEEAEILKILVSEGDKVEADQPLLEVETEKATVEVPAPAAGTVQRLLVSEGDRVEVGQPLLELETGEAEAAAEKDEKPERAERGREQEAAEEKAEEAPEEPEPKREARPPRREPAGRERAEKAPSRRGRRKETAGAEPDEAAERAPRRAGVTDLAERRRAAAPAEERPAEERPAEERAAGEPAPAAPSVRRLARELGIDVNEVVGSGPAGRISTEDVKAHARRLIAEKVTARRAAPSAAPGQLQALPDFSPFGEVEREAMSGVRRKTAESMTRSWLTIPHVTQFDRADVTALEASRRRYARRAAESGGKLTITAIVIKVLASAVRRFPKFNASLDVENEEVVFKQYVNIGVAVDTEHGLLVPVIRDADRLNVTGIAAALDDLSDRARRRKVRPEELRGANLTITNLGGLGTTYFSPLINWPEVAVLGVGRAEYTAVYRGDREAPLAKAVGTGADAGPDFEPRLILPLSVSYDHRLIDGADAARFLRWIAEALENPFVLSLEG